MSRPTVRLIACSLLWAAVAPAQPPVQGLVLTPEARPLAGAEISFHPAPTSALPWLASIEAPRSAVRTRSDERGHYRISPVASTGCVMALHSTGLGAIVAGAAPGNPDRIAMKPLSEISIAGEAGSFSAHVAFVLPDGETQYLGQWDCEKLRLPQGTYRLLVLRGDRRRQYTCRVTEGRTVELPALLPTRTLRVKDFDGEVSLAGWPGLALPRTRAGVPVNPGAQVLRFVLRHGADRTFTEVWVKNGTEQCDLPPPPDWADVRVIDRAGQPISGARVYTVSATAGRPVAVAMSVSNRDGRARRARCAAATRVVIEARGFGLMLIDDAELSGQSDIQLARGHEARALVLLDARDANDARGLSFELRYDSNPWCVFVSRTDARGQARFLDLPPGDATLWLNSDRHLPSTRGVSISEETSTWRVRADPGAGISGRVELGGAPAPGALIRLRDTTRQLARTRITVADGLGQFSFLGLPSEALLTLSAEIQRAGSTWSAQLRAVQPDGDDAVLELRLEDPPLPHQRDKDQ